MGMLVEGKWVDRWYDTKASNGKFVRQDAKWRDWVTADGKPAEGRTRGFKAGPGRYHLYVSLACPWAHRTLIVRRLKRLDDVVGMTVVDPVRTEAEGWAFRDGPGHSRDPINRFAFLREAYLATDHTFCGRWTVPVLWDRETHRIVNNS